MKDSTDHAISATRSVAILGWACRLPGARRVDEFWRVLLKGRCAIGAIGLDRWQTERFYHPRPGVSGKSYTFAAGLIENIWAFDATAFGISPREAVQMDPQQRLALMLAFEALEDAGLAPSALRGERVGVYAGASSLDHGNLRLFDAAGIDGATMTGNSLALVANRVSHAFDFRGESLAIDTACSASLVALHHAVGALRRGDVSLAVVIGVNVLLSPLPFIGFSAARMLSPKGICHPFGAEAAGYVRGEGGVALILARSDEARARRSHHGEIIATGVNADGHTFGIAQPCAASQATLLRAVHAKGGIAPDDLAFIEAHGTGTQAGDAAEAEALGVAVAGWRSRPLPIGSLKGNIGHLEPAAGLAGVLKASLALEHGLYPPTLSGRSLNPDIPFKALNLHVAQEAVRLTEADGVLAGISAFGFGGANAHVVIARGTRGEPGSAAPRSGSSPAGSDLPGKPSGIARLLCFTARCGGALAAMAHRHHTIIDDEGEDPARLAAALAHRRDLMEERVAILTGDDAALKAALVAAAQQAPHPALARGRAIAPAAKTALVFSGNGAQWAGMGIVAYESNQAFALAFDTVSRHIQALGGPDLVEAMRDAALSERLCQAAIAQPLLFAIEAALTDCLVGMGLKVAAVIGHSVGEVAAAYASGALTLDDAAQLIIERSRHQEPSRGAGTIAAAQLSPDAAETILREHGFKDVCIAAFNSPQSVTVSGSHEGIRRFHGIVSSAAVRCKILDIDYPFHSPAMDPCRDPLIASLSCLKPTRSQVPFVSTVTGKVCEGTSLDAGYWWRNVREPVLFSAAVEAASRLGCEVFLEVGPRPILLKYLNECLAGSERPSAVLATLGWQDSAAADPVRMSLARAFVNGAALDITRAFGEDPAGEIALPEYPWQLSEFRIAQTGEAYPGAGGGREPPCHPLIGVQAIAGAPVWRCHLDAETLPWLGDHKLAGRTTLPAAALAEMATAAACGWLESQAVEIGDLDITLPLIFRQGECREVEVRLAPESGRVVILSRPRLAGAAWETHATCRFRALSNTQAQPAPAGLVNIPLPAEDHPCYARLAKAGLDYGPAFRRLGHAQTEPGGEIMGGEVRASLKPASTDVHPAHLFDPIALDAALHALACLPDAALQNAGAAFVPVRMASLRLYRPRLRAHAARLRIAGRTPRSMTVDLVLTDEAGHVFLSVEGLRLQAARLLPALNLEEMALTWRAKPVGLPGRARKVDTDRMRAVLDHAMQRARGHCGETEKAREARLLLEAGAHRLAFDVLRSLADRDGRLDPAALRRTDRLHDARAGYLEALAHRLAAAGVVTLDNRGYCIAQDPALPALDAILRTVIADHPEWVADCVVLSHAAAVLPLCLPSPPEHGIFMATTREHVVREGPRHARRRQALVAAISALAESRGNGDPLRVAQVDAHDASLALALRPHWQNGTLTLCLHPGSPAAEHRLRDALPPSPHLDIKGYLCLDQAVPGLASPFDIVCLLSDPSSDAAADGLAALAARMLRAGGLFLLSPTPDSVLLEVALGLEVGWFPETATVRAAPGSASAMWRTALGRSGFTLPEGTACADILLPAMCPETVTAASPALSVHPGERGARVLAHAGQWPLAAAIRDRLRERGFDADLAAMDGLDIRAAPPAPPLDAASNGGHAIVLLDPTRDGCTASETVSRCLARLQSVLTMPDALRHVWICIEGGLDHLIAGTCLDPAAAALWAAARAVANEAPRNRIRLVDFDHGLSDAEKAERLAAWIAEPGEETELRLGRTGALRPSVLAGSPTLQDEPGRTRDRETGACLTLAAPGSTNRVHLKTIDRRAPAPGEVEIAVAAAGLNFRDVMWATGSLPEEAMEDGFAGASIGFECAGTVTRLGDGVADIAVGDRVAAMAPSAISSHVLAQRCALVKLPPDMPLSAAATMPTAFVTAHHALVRLARIERGEWLLIHGAAGGVGLAALQIAKARGARVIATAGAPEKRSLLSTLGAEHVLNSRTPAFADEIRALTGGVDVVLNSLSGEAMEQSLRLLKPFGRFIELGKRDFFAGTMVSLRPLRRNVSYFAVDADQLLSARPECARELFSDILAEIKKGSYTALPYRVFPAAEVGHAIRLMQQSGHMGKIVIAAPAPQDCPCERTDVRFAPCPEGIHIIIGGLGGVGVSLGEWLADLGAHHVVLAGRSGNAQPDAEATLAALRQRPIRVQLEACDVTDAAALDALLVRLRAEGPITGIIHAAMALDDAPFLHLTGERITAILRPKIDGASHLDRLTRADRLDYFVMLSSLSAMIGNPGQVPYAAANAYLEALAERRRREGLPALAIGFGAIADAGYLKRNPAVAETLARRTGGRALTIAEVCAALGELLAQGMRAPASVTVARLAGHDASALSAVLATPPFESVQRLVRDAENGAEMPRDCLAETISAMSESEACETAARLIAAEVAAVLRLPAESINRSRPLGELGMDSLMMVEFQLAAEQRLGLDMFHLAGAPGLTIETIAARLVRRIRCGAEQHRSRDADLIRTLSDIHIVPGGDDVSSRVAAQSPRQPALQESLAP